MKQSSLQVIGADALPRQIASQDRTIAQVARAAGCSRQFIHKLVCGEKRTCSSRVGRAIEEYLQARRGTLFVPVAPPVKRKSAARPAELGMQSVTG